MDILTAADRASKREYLLSHGTLRYHGAVTTLPSKVSSIAAATQVLDSLDVGYALIGGLAVGIRSGVPRATLDVDFAIESNADAQQVVREMTNGPFEHMGTYQHSINFRHQSGEPVQFAKDPEFDAMIARAQPIDVDGRPLPVVTTDDLITMKKRAAADPARRKSKSLQDQADLALLQGDVPQADEGW